MVKNKELLIPMGADDVIKFKKEYCKKRATAAQKYALVANIFSPVSLKLPKCNAPGV